MKILSSKKIVPIMGVLMFAEMSWANFPPETVQIEGTRILRDAKNLVLKNWKVGGMEVELQVVKGIPDVALPSGDVQWNIEWSGAKPFSGLMSLPVVITQNGHVIKKIMVALKTRIFRNVLVPVRSIERHSVLRKDDFVVARTEISADTEYYVDEEALLDNKRATRRLPAQMPIAKGSIEEDPLVKKGDRIRIVERVGVVEIAANGVAKSDGRAGKVISVMNLHSGKTMTAFVREAGEVEVGQNGNIE